jgi:hypothetical protein
MNKKVWIVTKSYWESSDNESVFDSKEKAEEYVKKRFKDMKREYKREDLGVEVTYYCASGYDESSSEYIITEWEVK